MYDTGRTVASQVIIKSGYNSADTTSEEDIALVKLSKPVPTPHLACLAKNSHALPSKKMTVTGWGNMTPLFYDSASNTWSNFRNSRVLKGAPVMDDSKKADSCKGRPGLLCIKGTIPGHASCKGDSCGSLVFSDKVVVALASLSGASPVPGREEIYKVCNGDAVYIRLDANIAWIEQNIGSKVCVKSIPQM